MYLYWGEWLIELRRYREVGRLNRLKTPGCLRKTFYHHRCLFALLKNLRESNSLQISGPSRLLLNLQTHSNLNAPNRNALHKLKCWHVIPCRESGSINFSDVFLLSGMWWLMRPTLPSFVTGELSEKRPRGARRFIQRWTLSAVHCKITAQKNKKGKWKKRTRAAFAS